MCLWTVPTFCPMTSSKLRALALTMTIHVQAGLGATLLAHRPALRVTTSSIPARASHCVGCAVAPGFIDEGTALLQLSDREHIGRIGCLLESIKGASFLPPPVIISAIWKPADLATMALLIAAAQYMPQLYRRESKLLKAFDAAAYERSILKVISKALLTCAQTLFAFYIVDALCYMGAIQFASLATRAGRLAEIFGIFGAAVAAARILSSFKTWFLQRCVREEECSVGLVPHLERLWDAGIWGAVALISLQITSLQLGMALKGLLAFGGVSGVVVALACKSPATELVSGLMLAIEEPFLPGERIECAGVKGKVESLGWLSTFVRCADGALTIVPNSAFAGKQVLNRSRATPSPPRTAIEATMPLRYADLPKVEALLAALRTALSELPFAAQAAAPTVHLAEFGAAAVHVKLSLTVAAIGDEADGLREQALLVAAKTVRDSGLEFSPHSSHD